MKQQEIKKPGTDKKEKPTAQDAQQPKDSKSQINEQVNLPHPSGEHRIKGWVEAQPDLQNQITN